MSGGDQGLPRRNSDGTGIGGELPARLDLGVSHPKTMPLIYLDVLRGLGVDQPEAVETVEPRIVG